MATDTDTARRQAHAQLEYIKELVGAYLSNPPIGGDGDTFESIQEHPLSVEVRSDWVSPGTEKFEAGEYCILLCTGGPAVRVTGTLGTYQYGNEPDTVRLEYQDWGTPWTEYWLTAAERDTVLTYARVFHYGQ